MLLFALVSGMALPASFAQAEPALKSPGVVLTFDDVVNIDNWVRNIPLFAKYGAKATFVVDRADQLTPAQIAGLKSLIAAGHEVGCHGFRHLKASELVRDKGAAYFLETEIKPAISALEAAGIHPKTYAYPMSQNSPESDAALKGLFVKLRTGKQLKPGEKIAEIDAFFTPLAEVGKRFCFVGKGLDNADDTFLAEQVFPALDRAKSRNELLVLYAHNIEPTSPRNHIAPDMLEKILQKAAEKNLTFYTLGSLPSE